ncbi:hypothetical protein HMPREF6123_1591 [Oribacterium sinus F0268]|uniref:Uncharacterized protein n=1 Tax=Oribacterium sinus F0268 TaxID=585501 RepID=C2KYM2_9FIRM|nr:hypothetical protein HMPREF6123_1591 [Oribacterium sinus F0268]
MEMKEIRNDFLESRKVFRDLLNFFEKEGGNSKEIHYINFRLRR